MGLNLKIFYKNGCPICNLDDTSKFLRGVEEIALKENIEVTYHDVNTADGLTEAAFESIGAIEMPVIIIRADEEDI